MMKVSHFRQWHLCVFFMVMTMQYLRHSFTLTNMAVFMALSFSSSLYAKESKVVIPVDDQSVVGTLNVPDNVAQPPVILMLHGFMGQKDELQIEGTDEGIYTRTARTLASQGIASLRIDFRGAGESDGQWADTTFSRQIEDAQRALQWLKKQPQINPNKVGLLGWSQGGLVASHVANLNPDLDAVVLWSPVTHPYMTYGKLMGADLVLKASASAAETPFTTTTPWGYETTLKGKFFKEVLTMNPIGAIAHYPGPLLVIQGSQDDLVVNTDAWMHYHQGDNKHVELNTDHVWGAFSGPSMLDERVLPETISWFNAGFKAHTALADHTPD